MKEELNNEQLDNSKTDSNPENIIASYADRIDITQMKTTPLHSILSDISSGVWKDKVEAIREETDDKKRKSLKNATLGYFNIGTFKDDKRENKNLISTRFMIFDFDHLLGKPETMKEKLKRNKKVYAAFISPSGDGLKVICRLERPVTDHQEYKGIYSHWANEFSSAMNHTADKTCDAARACYFSYDPDIYINEGAEPLQVIEISGYSETPMKTKKKVKNAKREELLNTFKGADIGNRNSSLIQVVGLLIETGLDKDFIKAILDLWNRALAEPLSEEEVNTTVDNALERYRCAVGDFWTFNEKNEPMIDILKLYEFQEKEGFGKTYMDIYPIFIKIKDNVIKEVSIPMIKDFVIAYVENKKSLSAPHRRALKTRLIRGANDYFGEKKLENLKTITFSTKKDTKDKAWIYYRNGIVIVDKEEGISFHGYDILDGPIWESQIIKRDYKWTEKKSDFDTFLMNASGKSVERYDSLRSGIGYLLHNFKDPSEGKAVVLLDEKISENPNGRSGKSLLGKGLSYMRNTVRIDGKNFKFGGEFALQQVERDTKLIDFNDVRKGFDFESLFSILTDSIDVEKKNHQKFTIPFEDSAKVLISTNYTIQGQGESFEARLFELELSDYYNVRHTPKDDFDKLFFTEWNYEDWSAFDNFMLGCLEFYLKTGLIKAEEINLNKRKLIEGTSWEFVQFMEAKKIETCGERNKDDFYNEFEFQYDGLGIKKNKFTKWLRHYGEYLGVEYSERNSNGKVLFAYKTVEKCNKQ